MNYKSEQEEIAQEAFEEQMERAQQAVSLGVRFEKEKENEDKTVLQGMRKPI